MTSDLVERRSPDGVAATVERITAGLARRGITLFAAVDHAGGARDVGMELADEVLLVFGSPAAGTPLMQADPRAGLDLPLRMLVWAAPGGTRVAFHDPAALGADYDLGGHEPVLARLRAVLDGLAAEATRAAAG